LGHPDKQRVINFRVRDLSFNRKIACK
jgi:hypothetical protein